MKKKLLAMLLVACMGLSVVGCSDKDDDASGDNASTDTRTTEEILSELDITEYVTLGEYKGLKLEKEIALVTDDDLQAEIDYALSQYPVEVTDRTDVKEGDTVNIDYVGRMDGKIFEGGSATDFDLTIGSGVFIDGFEEKLIGATVGETTVLDLAFPDPYPLNPDIAGEPVEFTVTVNSISAPLEEPTDEWVAKYVEGCETVEKYKEILRDMLVKMNELSADEQLMYSAWEKVMEVTTIHKYVDVLVEREKEVYCSDVEAYAESANMTLEEFLEYGDITMEQYDQYATEYAQTMAAQAMVNYAICKAEGFKIDDEGYKAELNILLEEYNCTEEELKSKYDRDNIEQTVLLNRVCDMIIDEAEVTEVESSEKAE